MFQPRFLIALFALVSTAAAHGHARAQEPALVDSLADSTVVQRWTLANGLRVVTRHAPRTGGVAVTIGYRFGTDQDPPNREGLAQLMGLLGYTAAAGDVPERTLEEMDSLRPLGWSFPVSRRMTLFTEVATTKQFPGVLSQMATRMRGVRLTQEDVRRAGKQVQQELGDQLLGRHEASLHFQIREVALDHSNEAILRRAQAKNIASMSVAEVREHMQRWFVPANAVLSIAGNLEKIDVRALVQNQFGSIPGGTPVPARSDSGLNPGDRLVFQAGVGASAGVLGIIAPTLDDSLHPSFYLTTMLIGTQVNHIWRPPGDRGETRYQYAMFDEPDLVRFYPPVDSSETKTQALVDRMKDALQVLRAGMAERKTYEELRERTAWQFGGSMPPELVASMRRNPILLHNLARSAAGRLLSGDAAFWDDYRRRFEQATVSIGHWADYFSAPENQVRLLFASRN